uniref:Uncharacterized protein n=1 Tax=Nelumbo nucifera TaxID=4432 RepID=A0A822XIV5_NELNU|nr:TPA_asm: hypothetical protein HUJ06_020168 [Nelumbo nucifera]
MVYLRDSDYNAGIYKTKWDSSCRVTAGSYEFIDVVRSEGVAHQQQQRYFVDVDFAGKFSLSSSFLQTKSPPPGCNFQRQRSSFLEPSYHSLIGSHMNHPTSSSAI